jgi:hypothetical protein
MRIFLSVKIQDTSGAQPKKREPAYCLKALHEHLDAAKEGTRDWYLTLMPTEQDKLLERYYSIGPFNFMRTGV